MPRRTEEDEQKPERVQPVSGPKSELGFSRIRSIKPTQYAAIFGMSDIVDYCINKIERERQVLLKIFQSSEILCCDFGFKIAEVSKDRKAFFTIKFPRPEYDGISATRIVGTYRTGDTVKYPRRLESSSHLQQNLVSLRNVLFKDNVICQDYIESVNNK